ncbi:hypothetical protein SARC_07226 [Sphaeroforma arctica JP610]|uniref:Uncharacterized protein n=1 Tax=Sphaeroforma arctica JP610 TaxID=667725 RepID=A0A0L0FUS1_9EUKA|nr:hypothetical protein SARC_07226 [Sphaeroforma arctica JP610]KNC80419.1 hypothetical protein SARC_07226 [Sphaeroforma arctica JP610]|eukprot:XP_014154321.1 hypothetical protein SARC_07226 [Sphaeroforma arctica JP610]
MGINYFPTPRDVKARDITKWLATLQKIMERYCFKVEIMIGQPHWPRGNAEVRNRGEWHRDNGNNRYCAEIMNQPHGYGS